MRTLDPTLQAAMDSGNYTPIVRAAILDPDDHSVVQYLDVIYFKMNGIDLDIEFYDSGDNYTDTVCLERGALINGVEYTIFSGIYYLHISYQVTKGKYVCQGSLVQPMAVNVPADVGYEQLIRSIIDTDDMVCSFKNSLAAWLDYKFFADGLKYATGNIYGLFALLKQKYLIHCCDNGINSILFFSAADVLALASQYTITLTDADTWSIQTLYRQFTWKDETKTLHTPGPVDYVVHNLGYLESTASPPNIPAGIMEVGETCATIIPNLKVQSGDCVQFDPGIPGYTPVKSVLDVTEIFDARGHNENKPAWYMELRPLAYFTNTSGGFVPTSVQYTSAYINLATYGFSNNLDASVTDVQKLADYIDDLDILRKSGNLAGLTNTAMARNNLGLGGMAVLNDAPSDGSTYGRKNAAWSAVHAAVTLGTNTASGLTLTGQQISLNDVFVQLAGDVMSGTLEIDVPTGSSRALILKSTDNDMEMNLLELRNSSGSANFRILPGGYVGMSPNGGAYAESRRMFNMGGNLTSASTYYGLYIGMNMMPDSSGGTFIGGFFDADSVAGQTVDIDYLMGMRGRAFHRATSTLGYGHGMEFDVVNNATGTITNAIGASLSIYNNSTGAITFAWGNQITIAKNSGSIGTGVALDISGVDVTHSGYGIKIGNITGDTDHYAIYTAMGDISLMASADDKMGLWGATPVTQPAKADHNDWAALSDVVQALVDVGIFDQV
jgi:hypothetical protein